MVLHLHHPAALPADQKLRRVRVGRAVRFGCAAGNATDKGGQALDPMHQPLFEQEIERAAEEIIASAKTAAERLAAEAEAKLQDFIARHTKMAQERIAQAEAQALADVRSAAADAAVAAAGTILGRKVKDKVADDLLTEGIAALSDKFN